jgi:hypothetical protein
MNTRRSCLVGIWLLLPGILLFVVGCRQTPPPTADLIASIESSQTMVVVDLAMVVAHEHLRHRHLSPSESEALVAAVLPHVVEDRRMSGIACLLLRLCRPDARVARWLSDVLTDETVAVAPTLSEALLVHGTPNHLEATCGLYSRQNDKGMRGRLLSALWAWSFSTPEEALEALQALRAKEVDGELLARLDDVIRQVAGHMKERGGAAAPGPRPRNP